MMLEKFVEGLEKQPQEKKKNTIDNMLRLKRQKLDRLAHMIMTIELEVEMLEDLQRSYEEKKI